MVNFTFQTTSHQITIVDRLKTVLQCLLINILLVYYYGDLLYAFNWHALLCI